MRLRFIFLGLGILFSLTAKADLPERIPVRIGDRFGYCDAQMKVLIPASFQDAMPFVNGRAVVRQGNQYGLINTEGNWIIAPEQDQIVTGRLLHLRKGKKFALADYEGCQLTEYNLDAVYELKSGYFLLDQGGKKGLANPEGLLIIPCNYEQVSQLRDDQGNFTELFAVRENGRLGLYNVCGDLCMPAIFENVGVFQDGFAVVERARQFGMIDAEGHLRIACEFDQLQGMSEGLVAAKVKNRWGFIDGFGHEVLPFIYESVQEGGFFQGRVSVNRAGAWVLMQRNGEVDFSLSDGIQAPGAMAEGLIPICQLAPGGGVRFGYANAEGQLRIPLRFDRAEPFQKGFAIVGNKMMSNNSVVREMRFGVIDRRGHWIVPPMLRNQTEARLKRDSLGNIGFTTLSQRGKHCFVDQRGNRFGCGADWIGSIQKNWVSTNCEQGELIAVMRDNLWGFCDRRGKLAIPCQYSAVHCFADGLARVWSATNPAEFFYIDVQGKAFVLPAS